MVRETALHPDILIHMVHFLPVESIMQGVLRVCKEWSAISRSVSTWSHLYFEEGKRRASCARILEIIRRAGHRLVEFSIAAAFLSHEERWSIWKQIIAQQGPQRLLRKITLLTHSNRFRTLADELSPFQPAIIQGPCSSCSKMTQLRTQFPVRDGGIMSVPFTMCSDCDYDWCFICSSECARPIQLCRCTEECGVVFCDCAGPDRGHTRMLVPVIE